MPGFPYPTLQMKLDLMRVPEKKARSTPALSKPDIGPQLSPSARAAMMRYAPCRLPLRIAVASATPGWRKAWRIISPLAGNSFGIVSGNARSWPMITVRGAATILARFISEAREASCDLASELRTQTNRAGQLLADVGPN